MGDGQYWVRVEGGGYFVCSERVGSSCPVNGSAIVVSRWPSLVDGALRRRRVVEVTVLVLVRDDHLDGFDQADDSQRVTPLRDSHVAGKFVRALRVMAFMPHGQHVSSHWNVRHAELPRAVGNREI